MSILADQPVASITAHDVLEGNDGTSLAYADDELLEFEPLSDDEVHVIISGSTSMGGHVVKGR
jgi:hypothetical protein